MQVTKEQAEPCTVKLDIEVEPDRVNRAFDRAYREFSGFTTVPGFRPGKAPRKVLERYVNQERLRERVLELVAAPAYQEALKQEQITPYTEPDVEFGDIAEGQTWQFTARVPMPPKVTLGDYQTISVERPIYTVTDEDVDRQIEAMRSEHARLVPVTDRGVQDGDVMIAETLITAEGEEPDPEPRRSLIRIGNNIPGFDEAVMGQKIDEERTFELTYPEDYQDGKLAGKKATFDITVQSISRREVPELTDTWVKEATPFQTVDELKADVRAKLEESFKELSDRVTENRIIDELIKRSQIDFPPVMVREEMEVEAHNLGEQLKGRMTYEQWLEANGLTEEQHQARMAADAEGRVRSVLVLRELARAEKLSPTDQETDQEFDRMAATSDASAEQVQAARTDRDRRAQVANVLVKRKLRDYLMAHAKIKDVPAEPGK